LDEDTQFYRNNKDFVILRTFIFSRIPKYSKYNHYLRLKLKMNSSFGHQYQDTDDSKANALQGNVNSLNQSIDYSKLKFPPIPFTDDGISRSMALRKKLAQRIMAINI
jgi:hypothetical protein